MKALKFLIVILIILAVGIAGTGFYAGTQVFDVSVQMVTNKTTTLESGYDYLKAIQFDISSFQQSYQIERIEIDSTFDGHIIPADYITSRDPNSDTVILVHGMGGNRVSVYPQAEMFLRNGYNVLTYDQRSSGENTAQYTTYGYLESKDLIDCIRFIDAQIDESKQLVA